VIGKLNLLSQSTFPSDNPDNNLKTPDLKRNLEDLNKAKQTIEIHKYDLDDDATDKTTTWMRQQQQDWQDWQVQRKEDKASQAPKDAVSHGAGGQYQSDDPYDDPEYNKNQGQE
jgi:hypothetical protein